MDKDNIRVRFAPSPTGYLHIGNLRNAFFDYLIAKKYGGTLILRIEDTDQKREVGDAVPRLLDIMKWCGIEFDEGANIGGEYGPYIQTERKDIYKKYADQLLKEGKAYYCFCSTEALTEMREKQQAENLPTRYYRACRDLSLEDALKRIEAGEECVVRQKMPLDGDILVDDELRGELKFRAEDLDDHVLIKSNGIPTYQFASVVDDHLMEITHVLRSEEWINSLPKNILLYRAFDWEPPKFIHPSLILSKTGGKLSKRQGDVAVEDFRTKGYLPEAILNFIALLGWSPYAKEAKGKEFGESISEVMTVDEMIEKFSIEAITTSPAVFDTEKLDFFNGAHIRKKSASELLELCRPYLEENLALTKNDYKKSDEFLLKVIVLAQDRLKLLPEIKELTHYFFRDELDYEADMLVWKKSDKDGAKECLSDLVNFFEKIAESDWNKEYLEEKGITHIKESGKGNGDYLWPMRAALTGEKASPSPFEMAYALGKEETITKLQFAINIIK